MCALFFQEATDREGIGDSSWIGKPFSQSLNAQTQLRLDTCAVVYGWTSTNVKYLGFVHFVPINGDCYLSVSLSFMPIFGDPWCHNNDHVAILYILLRISVLGSIANLHRLSLLCPWKCPSCTVYGHLCICLSVSLLWIWWITVSQILWRTAKKTFMAEHLRHTADQ